MINILLNVIDWIKSGGSFSEWVASFGTILASFVAVYFGAIKPRLQRARFKIDTPQKTTFHMYHDYDNIGKDGDMVQVGFFIEQISGSPSRDINILIKKIWFFDENRNKREWSHFVPSNLRLASNSKHFSEGVKRYVHLGVYGDLPSNDFVGSVFNLSVIENDGDPLFSSFSPALPSLKRYEIELMLSGENVQVLEFKIELNIGDSQFMGQIGNDGEPVGCKNIDSIEAKLITGKV